MIPDATLYLPSRALRVWARDAVRRWRCRRRFGHMPVEDWGGYDVCCRCGTPTL